MSAAVTTRPGPGPGPEAFGGEPRQRRRRQIAVWLFVCCALVFAMVVIGGLTRLTDSGLSMVDWSPLMRWAPPATDQEWAAMFELYRTSPEFNILNSDMDVEGFKEIFWLEFIHRLLGRGVGLVFALPFLFFLATRRIEKGLGPKLAFMFLLGGLQGLMGWYMVKSGLVDNPHVSPYRLTAHLGLALLIHAYMFWVGLGLFFGSPAPDAAPPNQGWRRLGWLLVGLIGLTALSGGFVAGLDAGMAYNTFPLMGGRWFPDGYFLFEPAILNIFENVPSVQFNHRVLALTTLTAVLIFGWFVRRAPAHPRARRGVFLMIGMVLIQVGLGIATLLTFVAIPLASLHQAGAMILLTLALFVTHQLRYPAPAA